MEVERATCVAPATCVALPGGVHYLLIGHTMEALKAINIIGQNKQIGNQNDGID